MSIGGNDAVEYAEQNPKWRYRTCRCCGRKFRVNVALFPHDEMCGKCREKMSKDD